MCIFWLVNLIKVTYLTIYQIEYPIKLDKKWQTLSKWTMVLVNWNIWSSWTKQNDIFNQDGQLYSSKMGHLMLPNMWRWLQTRLGNNLGLLIPTYLPTSFDLFTYLPITTYLFTTYPITYLHTSYLFSYLLSPIYYNVFAYLVTCYFLFITSYLFIYPLYLPTIVQPTY